MKRFRKAFQIAKHRPKKLIIFDIYENNAYDIQQELKFKYGKALDLTAEIGSIWDGDRLMRLMQTYHPYIVFHAAHKHVPLMEQSPQASAEALPIYRIKQKGELSCRFAEKKTSRPLKKSLACIPTMHGDELKQGQPQKRRNRRRYIIDCLYFL